MCKSVIVHHGDETALQRRSVLMYSVCRLADGACYLYFIVPPLLPGRSPETADPLPLFIHVALQSKVFSKRNGQDPIPKAALLKSEWPPGRTDFKYPSYSANEEASD